MKKILNIICTALLSSIVLTSVVSAKTNIKESSNNFTGDTYIIGSTKFDSNYTVTASRAAKAGLDEAYLRQTVYNDFSRDYELKIYYYSDLDGSWSLINPDGSGIVELTDSEVDTLEENLNIFFVNNEEKKLIITLPSGTNVLEETIKPNDKVDGEAVLNENEISVPASWINGFSFSTDKTVVNIELNDNESEELETPVIKYLPELEISIPKEAYVGEEFEFSISTILSELGYNFEGVQVTGDGGLDNKDDESKLTLYYKYGEETWIPLTTNFGGEGGFPLQTATSYFKAKFSEAGTYTFKYAIKSVENDEINIVKIASIKIISNDTVARVGDTYYTSLSEALNNAAGKEVVLLQDTTINEAITLNNLTTTLNLNGKTLKIEDAGTVTRFLLTGTTNFTVKNGIISVVEGTAKDLYAFKVAEESTLNIASDAKINIAESTRQQYGIFVLDTAKVNFAGEINIKNSVAKANNVDVFAISGNGTDHSQNTTIIINGGKINVEHGFALYLPQTGVTTISGGELVADTVVGIKSGKLNVTGGKLTAIGAEAEIVSYSNGIYKTGDVIVVEENTGYADNVTINITGGNLLSTNAKILHEYNPTNTLSMTTEGKNIYKNYIDPSNFFYTDEIVYDYKVDNVYYKTIEEALVYANNNEVVLVKDTKITNQVTINDLITILDLNGKTLTIEDAGSVTRFLLTGTTNLTVKNGVINVVEGVSKDLYAFKVADESILNVASNAIINIAESTRQQYGIFVLDTGKVNFAGEINIKNSVAKANNVDVFAISGNGTNHSQNTTIIINGGKINVEHGFALYLPPTGLTKIIDGELTADTVIGIKSGTLNIFGGTLTAIGDEAQIVSYSNGIYKTGDVIVVEENTDYADNVIINITGGNLLSTNAKILHEYNPTNTLTMKSTGLYYINKNIIDESNFYYTNEELPM